MFADNIGFPSDEFCFFEERNERRKQRAHLSPPTKNYVGFVGTNQFEHPKHSIPDPTDFHVNDTHILFQELEWHTGFIEQHKGRLKLGSVKIIAQSKNHSLGTSEVQSRQ